MIRHKTENHINEKFVQKRNYKLSSTKFVLSYIWNEKNFKGVLKKIVSKFKDELHVAHFPCLAP